MRLVKAGGKGKYKDKGCTEEEAFGEGKFEWTSGPGANRHFTGKASKTTLEGVHGSNAVTCKKATAYPGNTPVQKSSTANGRTSRLHALGRQGSVPTAKAATD